MSYREPAFDSELRDDELIFPKSWEEIFNLPGHCINVETSDLTKIVGRYHFSRKTPEKKCGLRCRRPHRKGYIVKLKDGHFTHVGWRCGEREFPEWATHLDRFTELAVVKKLREFVARARAEADRTIQDIETMERDVQPYSDLLDQLYGDLPCEVNKKLHSMAKTGRKGIIKVTKRKDTERLRELKKEGLVTGSAEELREDRKEVGRLANSRGGDFHKPKWEGLKNDVSTIAQADPSNANAEQLREMDRDWRKVQTDLEDAKRRVDNLVAFLSPRNIEEITKLLEIMDLSDESAERTRKIRPFSVTKTAPPRRSSVTATI